MMDLNQLEDFKNDNFIWQKETFPSLTTESCLSHLAAEAIEAKNAIKAGLTEEEIQEELGDILILFLCALSHLKYSIADIFMAAIIKMGKNKLRKWGKPNNEGYVEHLKD